MTVSAGVACFEAGDQADVGKLLERADGALYEAKAAGRNCVLAAGASAALLRAQWVDEIVAQSRTR